MERTGAVVVVLIVLTFLVAWAGNLTMTMTRLILSVAAALHAIVCLFCLERTANKYMFCFLAT
jgi:hypothetical protein